MDPVRHRRVLKVIILGDSGVGKTSLMNRFVKHNFSTQYKATIGADFLSVDLVIDGQEITLQIWDTAGQERFQSLGVAFYRGAECCILVYDVTSTKSFESLKKWKNNFLEHCDPPDAAHFPFAVLGNKIDVDPSQKKVSERTARQWCENQNGTPFFETSAKEAIQVDEAFKEVAQRALKRELQEEPIFYPEGLSLQETAGAHRVHDANNGSSDLSLCQCL